jgi:hypothetical protein
MVSFFVTEDGISIIRNFMVCEPVMIRNGYMYVRCLCGCEMLILSGFQFKCVEMKGIGIEGHLLI